MIKKEKKDNSDVLSDRQVTIDFKIGILHTIADAIYSTPSGKIREAVANSRDNDANWIVIILDQTSNTLFILDNGSGITEKRFEEILTSIGFGLLQGSEETKLSYFGLGLMSIFQLGSNVEIYTKPKGKSVINYLSVDTKKIFDQNNKNKSISFLRNCFLFSNRRTEKSRKDASSSFLEKYIKDSFGGTPDNFTEIIIKGLSEDDVIYFSSSDFIDSLTKILPLKYNPTEPFLKMIKSSSKLNKIKGILNNNDFCKTIDAYFGIQEQNEIFQLWKYFPRFRSDLKFDDSNILIRDNKDNDFAYYIVHSIAQDLYRTQDDSTEKDNGFWIRNQNFLVKGPDFLEKPGPGKRIIDQPLRNWVFGEIMHKNMNKFLNVSRTDFLYEKNDFRLFRDDVLEEIRPLNKKLRTIYKKKDLIMEQLVSPFEKMREPEGTLKKAEKKLKQMVGDNMTEAAFNKIISKRLDEIRNSNIEDERFNIETLVGKEKEKIFLGEDKDAIVTIDPALIGSFEKYNITWDPDSEKIELRISPGFFDPFDLVFMGETYKLIFVARGEDDDGISINTKNKKIFVNPFNRILKKNSVSILEFYIAIEIASTISQTVADMKDNIYNLLDLTNEKVSEFITPLGDELIRRKMFKN